MSTSMRRIVVFGATSAMARATARCFAVEGAELVLAARDAKALAALADELRQAGAVAVHTTAFDAAHLESLAGTFAAALEAMPVWDAVLIAHGEMPDQQRTEQDVDELMRSLTVNGSSAVWLANRSAALFEQQGHGCLAVIGSGAGVRGRRSTYSYGAAKAMLAVYCEGLRARLHRIGVPVLTVLPCFVDSPMTAYLPRRLRWIRPETAGARIHRAMRAGKDHVFIPGAWRLALMVARNLPEALLKRSRSEERFAARLAQAKGSPETSQSGRAH
jgi:decaprenylphospho-beta-D-erythro-pentofuranosid-2-ulose 2-reductase